MTGAGPAPLLLIAAVAGVWAILLLAALGARAALRSRRQAGFAVTMAYAALAAVTIISLGGGVLGWVAAAGMLFPFAIALLLAVWHFPSQRGATRVVRPRSERRS